jgi:hypothetical protein
MCSFLDGFNQCDVSRVGNGIFRSFRKFFSSAERFGTKFREFSVPRNRRNSAGTTQMFRLFMEIFVRGQSYFSRLPKYWPSPSPPGESVLPPQQKQGVHTRRAERGMWGGSIFWKTREIGLPSYNDLSTVYSVFRGIIFLPGKGPP